METLPVSSSSSQTLVHDASPKPPYQPDSHKNSIDDSSAPNDLQVTTAIECFVEEDKEDGSESEDKNEYYQEQHGDHWDEVVYWSPWTNWVHDGDGWPHNFMRSRELSKSNDELLNDSDNKRWLRKLSQFHRKDLPSLKVWAKGNPKLPLFKDDGTGDEYQLHLQPGLLAGLAKINCPKDMVPSPEDQNPWQHRADPLYQVRYRLPSDGAARREPASIPKFIIPLGKLAVRTSLREQWQTLCTKQEPPPTEITDYLVVIDAGHEDLPVWILVSQSILKDRMEHEGKDYPQLPIFNNALRNEEYGFDTACIFRSIRDLAQPDFSEACKLVGNTRSVADPRIMYVGEKRMAELSGMELPKDWSVTKPDEEILPEPVEADLDH
ncbi:hypothetical protein N8I77_010851 [Diaporthe amygdali]|uniref:Uncharacterized protein n=1 Tax=Phomopsis amygdali TaxID=1214568 RepID=A0AAD9S7R3_PHOAM|nr:hypothetical protein N8I77_010851 [Diaporthe amygdali]